MTDATESEDAELLIADPDDYHETQRLREIHNARRNVHDTLKQIDRYVQKDEHRIQRGHLANAVTAYVAELEPVLEAAGYDCSFEATPWNNLSQYMTTMGRPPDETEIAGYEYHMFVFRFANEAFAELKPLVTEDETDEWEV